MTNCNTLLFNNNVTNLSNSEGVVKNESQDNTRSKEKLYTESIVITVVGGLELHEYQVASSWREYKF